MAKKICSACQILVALFLSLSSQAHAVVIGSNTTCSRQSTSYFPNTDTNNTMLGFAVFENGFTLEDITTSCTFNDLFPVSGQINLGGGNLYLFKDMKLTNTVTIATGGKIYGSSFSIEFEKQVADILLPAIPESALSPLSLILTASFTQGTGQVYSVDWSMNSQYIAGCTDANTNAKPEFRIYSFNGTTLTTVASIPNNGERWRSARWNPIANYVSTGLNNGTQNLRVYFFNTTNNALTLSDSRTLEAGSSISYGEWHPSGNTVLVGKSLTTNPALYLYSFSATGSGKLNLQQEISITPYCDPTAQACSWAPQGDYVGVGTDNIAGTTQVFIYNYNGTSLSLTSSAGPGDHVQALDWSPTGSYIAVGLTAVSPTLRIYEFTPPSTLVELQSARTGLTTEVNSLQWHSSGQYLLVGYGSELAVYYFNQSNGTLTSIINLISTTNPVNNPFTVRWSPNMSYVATGNTTSNEVIVYSLITDSNAPFLFNNTALIFNSDVNITAPLQFSGNCRIDGRGRWLYFTNNGSFVVRPNSSLVLENIGLDGLFGNHINCMTDSGALTFRNSIVSLASNYTFSRGSILFDQDVMITGTSFFNYTTGIGSTINSLSKLILDQGITFSYSPRRANNSLIFMTDQTSNLYVNGSTLYSTRTGLNLSSGTLMLDRGATFTSEAKNSGEAPIISSSLNVNVLGGASVNMFGRYKFV